MGAVPHEHPQPPEMRNHGKSISVSHYAEGAQGELMPWLLSSPGLSILLLCPQCRECGLALLAIQQGPHGAHLIVTLLAEQPEAQMLSDKVGGFPTPPEDQAGIPPAGRPSGFCEAPLLLLVLWLEGRPQGAGGGGPRLWAGRGPGRSLAFFPDSWSSSGRELHGDQRLLCP